MNYDTFSDPYCSYCKQEYSSEITKIQTETKFGLATITKQYIYFPTCEKCHKKIRTDCFLKVVYGFIAILLGIYGGTILLIGILAILGFDINKNGNFNLENIISAIIMVLGFIGFTFLYKKKAKIVEGYISNFGRKN